MNKALLLMLSLVLAIGLAIPMATPVSANPAYTITVTAIGSFAPSPSPVEPLAASINWSSTAPINGGTNNTPFQVTTTGGSVTLTAFPTCSKGSVSYQFRRWVVAGIQYPTSQGTVTFDANTSKTATAVYAPILYIYTLPPDANPIGTDSSVWVKIGVSAPGIHVGFEIGGPNATASGFAYTDATGKATFTYTGNNDGTDNIWAYIDSNNNSQYDPPPAPGQPGEMRTTNTVSKSWVKNFVTGGGNIKNDKQVTWTFDVMAGILPEGGAVGEFDLVNHDTGVTYHLDNFGWLSFSGGEAESPPAIHDTARFRATGTRSDGAAVMLVVMIQDVAEPGKNADKIAVELVAVNGVISPVGLIGSVNVPESPGTPLQFETISGGNFQIHDMK